MIPSYRAGRYGCLDTLNSKIRLLLKKSKMAAMVPKWLPVIDMGVITQILNFSPVALQMAEIWIISSKIRPLFQILD